MDVILALSLAEGEDGRSRMRSSSCLCAPAPVTRPPRNRTRAVPCPTPRTAATQGAWATQSRDLCKHDGRVHLASEDMDPERKDLIHLGPRLVQRLVHDPPPRRGRGVFSSLRCRGPSAHAEVCLHIHSVSCCHLSSGEDKFSEQLSFRFMQKVC